MYDVIIISLVALPLSILLFLFRKKIILVKLVSGFFAIVFAFILELNLADVFYYPFKLQRADSELLYVFRNPFQNSGNYYFLLFAASIVVFILFFFLFYQWIVRLNKNFSNLRNSCASVILFSFILFLFMATGTQKLLPTYPLTVVKYNQLPLVQNSFHSFIYAVFRGNASEILIGDYIKEIPDDSTFSLIQNNFKNLQDSTKRNVVLFIMESAAYDFFDSSSRYKVKMPFLDSLITKSTFFNKSFSYSHNSNKGITAVLAGTPTLTEIPLYHSAYTNIPMTHLGEILAPQNYSSSFFAGDNYDDFGFAKCAKWLGFQHYYCMTDVGGYKKMQKHTMGLHDQYVLDFMGTKIDEMKPPFLAVNFNISTHYPNDLPNDFKEKYQQINRTPEMRSMSYYSQCLNDFFEKAKEKSWYKNTVFIFCSDHWMFPDERNNTQSDVEKSFRIALFIFDPQNPKGTIINSPVSQLDVMNTILHYSNYQKDFISYGKNLLGPNLENNRTVFAKENNILYQAFDSTFILGFNALQGKVEFCYNYTTDKNRVYNLAKDSNNINVKRLSQQMKAFLRKAYLQYENKIVR